MRIVGGALAGRRFGRPGKGTRPTADRVREALASALVSRARIEGARVLDLFAGTGALAFEALSRGAIAATLVERDRRAAMEIEKSARELDLEALVKVSRLDLTQSERAAREIEGGPFDLVFADPPYAIASTLEPLLSALLDAGHFAAGATLVVEHGSGPPPALPRSFELDASYRYGDTRVILATFTSGD